MSEPKAKWKLYSDGDWCADIGSYSVNAAPDRGAWWVDSAEGELASAEKPGPCDVVTLMLAAESALATHLRAVADTMTWPEVESESLGPTEFVDCLTWQPPSQSEPRPGAYITRDYPRALPALSSPPPPMYKIANNGPTAIYVDGARCEPGESLAPPPMQACPNCMTMTAEHKLGCMNATVAAVAAERRAFVGAGIRPNPSLVADRHGPSCLCVGCMARVRTIASLQQRESFCGITDGVRAESGEALALAKVGGGAIGEVISNTGESTIYVRGMRIAPGHQISRRKDGGVEARCIACGSLSVWCQCTFANNKKPPTPEGIGGRR